VLNQVNVKNSTYYYASYYATTTGRRPTRGRANAAGAALGRQELWRKRSAS